MGCGLQAGSRYDEHAGSIAATKRLVIWRTAAVLGMAITVAGVLVPIGRHLGVFSLQRLACLSHSKAITHTIRHSACVSLSWKSASQRMTGNFTTSYTTDE